MPPSQRTPSRVSMPPIDTLPDSPAPPEPLIEAAMRDIPRTMADMENTRELYAPALPPGQRVVLHRCLVRELGEKHRHGRAASEWAIHRLVGRGFLTARYGQSDRPSWLPPGGVWQGGERDEVAALGSRLIGSTERLWEWRGELENLRSAELREEHLSFLDNL